MDSKWHKLIKEYELHCQKIVKATTIDIGESPKDKAARIRKLEKAGYVTWFEYYFPHYARVACAPFHAKLANMIIGNRKSKTFAEIYRSGAKSTHVNLGIPIFLMVTGELFFHLLVGETSEKAKRLLGDIQAELEFNQRFINDYGRKLSKGTWADGDFKTTDGIRFVSLGFGQSPRGLREGSRRPDYITFDDVDTKKHVKNNVIMQDSVDFILEEAMGCFDSSEDSTERLVYTNNNFHKNSITNRLKTYWKKVIQIDKQNGDKSDYHVLSVTAVVDLISFIPTWPEKTSSEYWRKKYQKNPRAFLREYMHIHVDEGKIFKPEYMQWKDMLKLREYDSLIFIGDLSYKDKGDFKAMFLIGIIGKEFHIIYCFCRQTSRKILAEWLYDLYEDKKLHRFNIKYEIDGLFAQDEFINDFDAEGDERGYYIDVIANKEKFGDKFNHIESIEGKFMRFRVFWNAAEKGNSDQVEAIDQFLAFEKGSQSPDDAPDAVAVGFKKLERMSFVERFDPIIIAHSQDEQNTY